MELFTDRANSKVNRIMIEAIILI